MSDNNASTSSNTLPPVKIGFKFNKISKPKFNVVQVNKLDKQTNGNDNDNLDYVTSIDNNLIKGTKIKSSEEKEIVIPLIVVNKYITKETAVVNNEDKSKIDDQYNNDDIVSRAKNELINDAKNSDDSSKVPAWKSLIINKVPDEYENDSKLDVSIRPPEPKLEDYESIPIEAFGLAMLKGMGWKEGGAIGGINKSITPIFEPQIRAKGLGLGADASLKKQLQESSNSKNKNSVDNEPLLRKGCHVCIEIGPYKGFYGIVENVSEDLSFVTVKLTLLKETIDLPQGILRIVTKKEFDQEGRIINKSKYEDYQMKGNQNSFETGHNKDKDKNTDKSYKKEIKEEEEYDDDIWLMPNIRAEIIDKHFKNGKYYKDKVVILETNGKKCKCQTKSKRILEDITQSMLRTVIPRDSSYVMILRGKYKGKLARIEDIDRKRDTVSVKLTGIISKPISYSLDDISEYYNRH